MRPRAQVSALPFPGSGVLVDVPPRRAHVVNGSALATWACLDGVTVLGEVMDELAGLFAVDRALIESDVLTVIEQYLDLGFVELVTGTTHDELAAPTAISPCIGRDLVDLDGHRYIMLPPSGCQQGFDALPWFDVCALAVGDHRLGVRSNSAEADALVRQVFARHVIDDDRVAPNYSVVLLDDDAEPAPVPAHQRSGLYEGNQWLGTGPGPAEIFATLARRLAASVPDDPPLLRLEALTVIGDTGASLLPWFRGGLAESVTALAERPGWSIHPAPVWIDAGTDTLVLDPPGVQADLAGLAGPTPYEPGSAHDAKGLVGIVMLGSETARIEGAEAAAELVPLLTLAPADDVEALLDLLGEVVGRVPVVSAPFDDMADVAAALVRAR